MSEFKREHRYYVFKRKHLSPEEDNYLSNFADEHNERVSPECVVVEADWPENEIVWQMIQDRIEGKPNRIALKAQLATGAHTCSVHCKRPLCRLRRENEALKGLLRECEMQGAGCGGYYCHAECLCNRITKALTQTKVPENVVSGDTNEKI